MGENRKNKKIYQNRIKIKRNQVGYVPVKRKVSCLFCMKVRKFYTAEAVTEEHIQKNIKKNRGEVRNQYTIRLKTERTLKVLHFILKSGNM